MATFLELGLLNYFAVIFPALLIFVVVFAIFEKYKLIGENKAIHAVIAISIAFIVMISQNIIGIINFIAPWFVLIFIFTILLLMVYKIVGASDEAITNFIHTDSAVKWFIFAIGIIIIVAGIAHVYGQQLVPVTGGNVTETANSAGELTETGKFSENVAATFFHPKVIGLIFVMLVAVFSISLLTQNQK